MSLRFIAVDGYSFFVKTSTSIILGQDPTVLPSKEDPSGFFQCGFDQRSANDLLALAQRAWNAVHSAIPTEVTIPLPQVIALYGERPDANQTEPAAAVQFRFDRKRANVRARSADAESVIDILHMAMPEIRGVVVKISPSMLTTHADDLQEILVHEIIHVLTHKALAASRVLAEACTERLTDFVVPPRPSREFRHLSWRPKEFVGTCGFRIDDFAETQESSVLRDVMHMYALNCLRSVSREELWNIVALLLRDAHATGFCPSSHDIFQTMQSVLGSGRADSFLASALLTDMRVGKQCFLCPFGDDELYAACIEIKKNNHYLHAPADEPWKWDKYQYDITHASATMQVNVFNNAALMTTLHLKFSGMFHCSFRSILRYLLASSEDVSKKHATHMECDVLGLRAVLKRPPENDSGGGD